LKKGADVEARDHFGWRWTPLMRGIKLFSLFLFIEFSITASSNGYIEIIKEILA
jgi:hypothetical protein